MLDSILLWFIILIDSANGYRLSHDKLCLVENGDFLFIEVDIDGCVCVCVINTNYIFLFLGSDRGNDSLGSNTHKNLLIVSITARVYKYNLKKTGLVFG